LKRSFKLNSSFFILYFHTENKDTSNQPSKKWKLTAEGLKRVGFGGFSPPNKAPSSQFAG